MTRPILAGEHDASLISIVIPIHNGADVLGRCLTALRQYVTENCEILVVDDNSSDTSAEIAKSSGVLVVRSETRGGPGAARNAGAQAARGATLVFLDADVCVHHDTLTLLTAQLEDETVGAVFGSYDAAPSAPHLISRFRNLLHHHVHQTACVEASTFWAGCGAIRKSLFLEAGGFDPGFTNPSVEDIELGIRLRKAGHRVVLCKQAQVTHLKRWTLWTMCTTDLWRRGVPWSRLILREHRMPNDLNVKTSQRLSVILTFALVCLFCVATWKMPWFMLFPLLFTAAFQLLDNLGKRTHLAACAISVTALVIGGICVAVQLPTIFALGFAGIFGTWLINRDFYRFLTHCEGRSYAIAVFPFHMLYFLICGLAFAIAACRHLASSMRPFRRFRANEDVLSLPEHELTSSRAAP